MFYFVHGKVKEIRKTVENKTSFSSQERGRCLKHLEDWTHDLLVVGGGLTGAALALKASGRGLKVALVEQGDFASGASGAPVLPFEESPQALSSFRHMAPHLFRPGPWLELERRAGSFGKLSKKLELGARGLLKGPGELGPAHWVEQAELRAREPLLADSDFTCGVSGPGYQISAPRLCLSMLRGAAEKGASVLNYLRAETLIMEGGRVSGAWVRDLLDPKDEDFAIHARHVVLATGAWDRLWPEAQELKVATKAILLSVPRERLPLRAALRLPAETPCLPWLSPHGQAVAIGGVLPCSGEASESGSASDAEVRALLAPINEALPALSLQVEHVQARWAAPQARRGKASSGFRSTSEGLSLAWLGSPRELPDLARKILDSLARQQKADARPEPSRWGQEQLAGGDFDFEPMEHLLDEMARSLYDQAKPLGATSLQSHELFRRHGTQTEAIVERAYELFDIRRDKHHLLARAELAHCVESEMLYQEQDFLWRRTDLAFAQPGLAQEIAGVARQELPRLLAEAKPSPQRHPSLAEE